MSAPTVTVNDDGLLVAEWAGGEIPETFTISSGIFRQLLGEANLSRLRGKALTELHAAIGKMIAVPGDALTELPT